MASSILASARVQVEFEPSVKAHRAAYAHFVTYNRWPDGFRFQAEWPSTSVVATVESKLARYAIRSELEKLPVAVEVTA